MLEDVKANEMVNSFIQAANDYLGAIGYTEHGYRHVSLVSSVAADIGEAKDVVPIKYNGEKIDIVFNPSYVKDPLKAIDEDEVTIELNNGSSPAIIRCSVPFLYVMMPLRIN